MTVAAKYNVVEMNDNKQTGERNAIMAPSRVKRSIKPVLDVIVCRSSSEGYNSITQVKQLTREGHSAPVIERTERSAAWATIINWLLA